MDPNQQNAPQTPPPEPPQQQIPPQSSTPEGQMVSPPSAIQDSAILTQSTPTQETQTKGGIPTLIVIAAILLGVSLIVVGFFAYENYQLRQTSLRIGAASIAIAR